MTTSPAILSKYEKLLELTEGKYEAFLYDCDGTLADNMQAHKDAYVKTALHYGIALDPAIIDELAGLPTIIVASEISKRYNTPFDATVFADAKSQLFYDEFMQDTKPVDFVRRHLIEHSGKIKIGVVSGGRRQTVTKTLTVLGLLPYVEVLVCAGETPNGKPFADPFLKAAALLEVDAVACMVFEDGEAGCIAAEAAGMQWIRIDKI
jgi:HAD superfamily hydrolase (TIGR01509 family)